MLSIRLIERPRSQLHRPYQTFAGLRFLPKNRLLLRRKIGRLTVGRFDIQARSP
jgi:hypothetical protein